MDSFAMATINKPQTKYLDNRNLVLATKNCKITMSLGFHGS